MLPFVVVDNYFTPAGRPQSKDSYDLANLKMCTIYEAKCTVLKELNGPNTIIQKDKMIKQVMTAKLSRSLISVYEHSVLCQRHSLAKQYELEILQHQLELDRQSSYVCPCRHRKKEARLGVCECAHLRGRRARKVWFHSQSSLFKPKETKLCSFRKRPRSRPNTPSSKRPTCSKGKVQNSKQWNGLSEFKATDDEEACLKAMVKETQTQCFKVLK